MIRSLFPRVAPLYPIIPIQLLPVVVHQPQWLLLYVGPLVLVAYLAGFLKKTRKRNCPRPPPASPQAASALPNRRAKCKTIDVVSDGDCDGESDGGTSLPPPTELASDDYESLKAMADADNQVCASHFPLIFIIFSSQLRLRSPNPGRSVLPTYASCSTARRTTSIQSPGSVWMVTGARFASQTLLSRKLHVS